MLPRALVLTAIALVSIPTPGVAQAWSEYRPQGAWFVLEMPGEWTSDVQNVPTAMGTFELYTAEVAVGGRDYFSGYGVLPPDLVRRSSIEDVLDGARDAGIAKVRRAHGRVRREERITIDNRPGRQIVIEVNHEVVVERFFMLDATLVQVIVVGPDGVENEPNTIRFLQSLRVVAP